MQFTAPKVKLALRDAFQVSPEFHVGFYKRRGLGRKEKLKRNIFYNMLKTNSAHVAEWQTRQT